MIEIPRCRFGDRCELETYEQAIDCLGSHSELTRTEIARRVAQIHPQRSEAYIRSCLSPYDGTHNLQFALAPTLTKVSGNPALLVWHARQAGYVVHRLPPDLKAEEGLLAAIADVQYAVGQAATAVQIATRDRRVSRDEQQQLSLRCQHVIQELVSVIDTVYGAGDPMELRP